MLQIVEVNRNSADLDKIKALYERAFPENERLDFDFLLDHSGSEDAVLQTKAAYDGTLFVGFVTTIRAGEVSHISYFAVDDTLRGQGYGSEILRALRVCTPGQRFMLDVEKPDEKSDNNEQREKRIRFYYRNGYRRNDVEYPWNGVVYWILSYNGEVSKEDVKAFGEQCADLFEEIQNEMSKSGN